MKGVNKNGKIKGNGVAAKLLFFVCMNFPYYCNTIYLIIIIRNTNLSHNE